ncbi:MAG: hypothetical protein M0O93_06510, partial [Bacteroidales bacterium]|nr:hypothetical protein [Bacteroidales bacterium]
MTRLEITKCVGVKFLTSNIENGEFRYSREVDEKLKGHYKLDLRFFDEKTRIAVLIETKKKFTLK